MENNENKDEIVENNEEPKKIDETGKENPSEENPKENQQLPKEETNEPNSDTKNKDDDLNNVEQIVKENEQLKGSISEKDTKITELEAKIKSRKIDDAINSSNIKEEYKSIAKELINTGKTMEELQQNTPSLFKMEVPEQITKSTPIKEEKQPETKTNLEVKSF